MTSRGRTRRASRTLLTWMRDAALSSVLGVALGWVLAVPTAAQDSGGEQQIELPLVYEGGGLRVVVATVDQETWQLTGTLELAGKRMSFQARVVEDANGEEVTVGYVSSANGRRPLRVVEENDTVAVVTFGGKTYRTTRVRTATPPDPPDVPNPEPKPTPEADPKQPRTDRPAPARPAPAGRIVMKLHTVRDKGSGNMESHTLLAPSGWKVEGGAWWPSTAYFRILPSQDIRVTAPDGRLVRMAPSIGATWFDPNAYARQQLGSKPMREGAASEGTLVLRMPTSMEEWKTLIVEKGIRLTYPKATNIRAEQVVVVPELTALLQRQLEPIKRQNAEANRQSEATGGGTFSFTDGAVLGASTTYELDGKRWEQLDVFGASHSGLDTQVGRQVWWSIEPNVSFRAPAGQLEANLPLMLAVSYSLRMTPAWAKMKAQHAAKMNQIAAKGAADRARIWAESNREINRIINDGHRARSAIRDATHRKVINSIRGVDDYTTSSGGTSVQLPSDYSHVFTNGNDEYVLTNDANYDPNIDPAANSTSWERMNPVDR